MRSCVNVAKVPFDEGIYEVSSIKSLYFFIFNYRDFMASRHFRPNIPSNLRDAQLNLIRSRDALSRVEEVYPHELVLLDSITSAELFIAEAKKALSEKPDELKQN